MMQTPSKIPTATRTQKAVAPVIVDIPKKGKRRTRVSELLARISSGTVSYRTRLSATKTTADSSSQYDLKSNKTLIPLPAYTVGSGAGVGAGPIERQTKNEINDHNRHSGQRLRKLNTHNKDSSATSVDSADFFPQISANPPAIPRPLTKRHSDVGFRSKYKHGTSSIEVAPEKNRRHSAFINTDRTDVDVTRRSGGTSTSRYSTIGTYKHMQYLKTQEPSSLDRRSSLISLSPSVALQDPPGMPLPIPEAGSAKRRSVSEGVLSNGQRSGQIDPATIPSSRPTSRAGNVRPSSRVATRKKATVRIASAGQASGSLKKLQVTRMEELKAKIWQLEEVLRKDSIDRKQALDQAEQIQMLQDALNKETRARQGLESLLRKSLDPDKRESPIISSENLSIDLSGLSDLPNSYAFSPPSSSTSEDLRKSVCTNMSNTTVTSDEDYHKESMDMVALQTEVSVLSGDNKTLTNEKQRLQSLLKQREDELKRYHDELITINDEKIDLRRKEEVLKLQVKSLEQENRSIIIKKDEELEHVHTLNSDLQHASTAYQISRKQYESRITHLENSNRRSKRYISALEISLQDLKISLEERAFEIDELNWSINKIMMQANQTIEDAKRHATNTPSDGSIVVPSPPTSPMSPDVSSLSSLKMSSD